jgi:membrane protease YdiL (CAAX protease family)
MFTLLRDELKMVRVFLRENFREIIITGSATLFIVLDRYYPIGENWTSDLIYLGVAPLTIIVLVLRENPLNFGLRKGYVRVWAAYVAVTCALASLLLLFAASLPALRDYYRISDFVVVPYFLTRLAGLAASEFLFRGFLLFGLKDRLGEASILVQTIPFVLVHFGKPGLETLSTLITGLYFGYVACRGRSFWPVFLIHLFINIFFVTVVNLAV